MDFLNRCRTCFVKGNQEKEDLINITNYCVLGKSYKYVLRTLIPNIDDTFLTNDNCVCKICAETLKRSALLIHKCLMIETKLRTISLQQGKNNHKDITEKNCIEENIPISKDYITRALEILNKDTCVPVNTTTAGNINEPSQNDYTKEDSQHDSKEKSTDNNNDSFISSNSTNLSNTSLLDGVKEHDRVISLNSSDRPVLEKRISRIMEHGINFLDLSRNDEENGKDIKKRIILIGLDQPTKCPICSKSIKYPKVHNCPKLFKPEVPKLVQKCNVCDKVIKASLIDKHLQKHVLKTQNAQKQKGKPVKEKRIKAQQESQREYKCQTCCEKFTSKEEFQLHLELHPPFVCEICSKRFVKRCSLKAHMVTHNDQNSYICEVCGRGFKDKGSLRVHLTSHRNDDKTYPCAHCPKVFKHKVKVARHMKRVHENKLKSQCPECGKLFTSDVNLRCHTKVVHLKEKPYQCHICQKMFGRTDYLRNHISRHTSDEPPQKGRRNGKKLRYVLPKDNGKPAPCKFCGLWYADMIRLERHLKTHFKRYKCRFCPLTFAQKSLCVRHEKVLHEGVMSNFFRCNVCWKRLVSKEALDEHIKRHNKPRYTCDLCGKKFNRRFVMNHHKVVDHSNMPDNEKVDEIIYNSLVEASSNVTNINPDDLLC